MITSIELTESGTAKFNKFFADYAGEFLDMQATLFELLEVLTDRVNGNESLVYELGKQYTNTGKPECLHLSAEDILTEHEN